MDRPIPRPPDVPIVSIERRLGRVRVREQLSQRYVEARFRAQVLRSPLEPGELDLPAVPSDSGDGVLPFFDLEPSLLVEKVVDRHHHLDRLFWRFFPFSTQGSLELLWRRVDPFTVFV